MLERYEAQYPDERDVVGRIRRLVKTSPDCFERTCRPGHVTGSAWVLSHDQNRCLAVHHRKLGRWLQPGGHADGQSEIEQVALREVREESGLTKLELAGSGSLIVPLDIDVHLIPTLLSTAGSVVEDAHEHHDIRFLVQAAAGQQLVVSDESHEVRWFTRDEVLEIMAEESVLRMLRKAGPAKQGNSKIDFPGAC